MNQQEIKNKINELNNKIESCSTAGFFILNKAVVSLNEQISQLQQECEVIGHSYNNGICEYCGKEE